MNKVRVGKLPIIKLPIVAGHTSNLFQNYFKGVIYGGSLLNCTKISLIVLCYKSRLGVDLKIRISIASQEKENKILCIANEEMGVTTFNS